MDDRSIGRTLRTIRHRLGLRQVDLGVKAGVSQQLVSIMETGGIERLSLRTARRLVRALGAELVLTVRWRGADIDRVRDEDHSRVVAQLAAMLEADGWVTAAEVTYSWYGERGSIDLLAYHPATRTLLVVEAKTEIVSVEETLRRHDQKVRLAARVARERFGWDARDVTRLLAVREARTARRRIDRHDALFRRAYPTRGWAARTWVAAPVRTPGVLLFLPATDERGGSPGSATVRRVRRVGARTIGARGRAPGRPSGPPREGASD